MGTSLAIQLEYEHDSELAGAITLPHGQLIIGRSASCFLVLTEPSVSRLHLRLRVDEDEVVAEDLGSTNGTMINGLILRGSMQLKDSDELKVGSRIFRVKLVDPRRSEPRTTPLDEALLSSEEPTLLELDHICSRCGQPVHHQGRCSGCGLELQTAQSVTPTERNYRSVSRRERRCKVELHARYEGQTRIEGTVANINRNGLFLACGSFDAIGTRCRVELITADGDSAVFEGFVRHVIRRAHDRRTGMGIEFAAVDEEGVRWLAKQLLKALKRQ